MYDVIVIGSALVDIFIHSNSFISAKAENGKMSFQLSGDKVEVDNFRVCSGGGGSNIAVGLSRQGYRTALISEIGKDEMSQIVLSDLKKENVSTGYIITERLEKTGGSVILVGEDGGRMVMTHRGASSQLDPFDISPYWLSQGKWIHLSSIAGRKEVIEKVFNYVNKNPEIGMSWNPGKAELMLLAEKKLNIENIPCQIFVLNLQEWEMVKDVKKQILNKFPQIVVTNGDRGGKVFIKGSEAFSYGSTGIKSVDDTGAGDAFTSGYLGAHLAYQTPQVAAKWGVSNASSVIKFYGAKLGLLRRRDIELS